MSASLVGSEMCIRDSYGGERSGRATWLRGAPSCCGKVSSPKVRRPSGAVSYTHLTLPTICSV
eukprot:14238226-Alexandrium_andersonii.AAC.1